MLMESVLQRISLSKKQFSDSSSLQFNKRGVYE